MFRPFERRAIRSSIGWVCFVSALVLCTSQTTYWQTHACSPICTSINSIHMHGHLIELSFVQLALTRLNHIEHLFYSMRRTNLCGHLPITLVIRRIQRCKRLTHSRVDLAIRMPGISVVRWSERSRASHIMRFDNLCIFRHPPNISAPTQGLDTKMSNPQMNYYA